MSWWFIIQLWKTENGHVSLTSLIAPYIIVCLHNIHWANFLWLLGEKNENKTRIESERAGVVFIMQCLCLHVSLFHISLIEGAIAYYLASKESWMDLFLLSRKARSQDDKRRPSLPSSIRICSLERKEQINFMTCQLAELFSYTNKLLWKARGLYVKTLEQKLPCCKWTYGQMRQHFR